MRLKKEYCNVLYGIITTLAICLLKLTNIEWEKILSVWIGITAILWIFLDSRTKTEVYFG